MTRTVLADDQALIRIGLRSVLSAEPGVEVVGEATDGAQAIDLCRKERPDLVLMDIEMPQMDGIEATRIIKEELPRTSVLVLTIHDDPDYLLRAIGAGAAGYLLKDHALQRVAGAVRRVVEGESPVDQELAMRLLRRVSEGGVSHERSPGGDHQAGGSPAGRISHDAVGAGATEQSADYAEGVGYEDIAGQLTAREREVLGLISRGRNNGEIAKELYLGVGTVKTHVHRIIAKLGVSDRTQAAVLAIRLGLAEGP